MICFFWCSIFLLFHTYFFYPLILRFLYRKQAKQVYEEYTHKEELPFVSVLLPVYNEAEVLLKKFNSLVQTSYPKERIEILVGSDASTDATNEMLQDWSSKYSFIHIRLMSKRIGKTGVINELAKYAKGDIFVFTDANVFFRRSSLFSIIKKMKDASVGLVGGNIVHYNLKKEGISLQEKHYTTHENIMKYREGELWGAMMGAFGGFFAVKKKYFSFLPQHTIVDDFFISMKVIEQHKKAIFCFDAFAHEDVSNEGYEEFRRKKRIAVGNFQNLGWFKHLLWSNRKGVVFSFLSHKVLRWFGPLALLLLFVSNVYVREVNLFYSIAYYGQLIFYFIPVLEYLCRKLNIHFFGFRFVTHFVTMNIALFVGMFSYLFVKKSQVWKPTKRFQ